MPRIVILLFAIVCMTIGLNGFSQSPGANPNIPSVIKIDPNTNRPENAIPFDAPFTLILTMDDVTSVDSVWAYEVIYKRRKKSDNTDEAYSYGKKIRVLKTKPDPAPGSTELIPFQIEGVKWKKDAKQNLLTIEFPPLPPNFHFDFTIVRYLNGDTRKEFRNYLDLIADSLIWGKAVDGQKVEDSYYYFYEKLNRRAYPDQPGGFWMNYWMTDTAVQGCPVDEFNTVRCFYTVNKLDSVYQAVHDYDFTAPLPTLAELYYVRDHWNAAELDLKILVPLSALVQSSNPLRYLNGQVSIKNLIRDEVPYLNLAKRIENLDSTITQLKVIRSGMDVLLLSNSGDQVLFTAFINQLESMMTTLTASRKMLVKANTNIEQKIVSGPATRYTDWYVSTTEVKDLQTKSSYIFTPQIGLSLLAARNNDNSMAYIPKLNWGININFRPIDKLIKRKYIPHPTVWHYLSLHVGLTIGNFREKEYENLYSNTSLLVGPSLRLTRVIYFSTGLSLFRQEDNNPLITKYNVAAGGYASLLLDLDITNAISTIRGVLFK